MRVCFPKEEQGDKVMSILPGNVPKYLDLGVEIGIESGIGWSLNISDEEYVKKGAIVVSNSDLYKTGAAIFRSQKPNKSDVEKLEKDTVHLSFLDPFNEKELIDDLALSGVKAVSVEMIPRSTRAQKMDALSSQANLAGYSAVIAASHEIGRALPMMMTPSGTIPPCKVFIVGVGVAGLQAIATAKRLGARVEAFDTRAVVEEQVQSLGAKFLKIDLGETSETKNGYAKALTEEQIELQKAGMVKACAQADIVITTAMLFGRAAPRIITDEMINSMKPGSVIVDMAVSSGGNVEGSVAGQTTLINGVKVLGIEKLAGEVGESATMMYANNLYNFFEEFWDKENRVLSLDPEDDIIAGCLITSGGVVVNKQINQGA